MAMIMLDADKIKSKYKIEPKDGMLHVVVKCRRGHRKEVRIRERYFMFECNKCAEIEEELYKWNMNQH